MVTFNERVKFAPQVAPAKTVTIWALVDPEMDPLPLIDQEQPDIPAGAKNWELDRGRTEDEPAMEQVGIGATVRTTSEVSVQALD